jgi:hypothetical protein
MSPDQIRQLNAHRSQLRHLAAQIADQADFVCSGTLLQRFKFCGNPTCRCHGVPPQPHGPYWQWSYRPTGGKTVSRQVDQRQADLYRQWIANRRRLIALVDEMEEVSRQAAEILLAEPPTSAPATTRRVPRSPAVTRHLAQAVTLLAELIEPVAEAAQEWLESKDDDDREALTEARERLLAAVIEAPDLASTSARLARLLGTAAWPR